MRVLIILVFIGAILGAVGALAYHFRLTLLRWKEKIAIFVKEVRVEMQKVVWPSRQEVYGATFVVLVSVFALTVAIWLEDLTLSWVLDLILKLA